METELIIKVIDILYKLVDKLNYYGETDLSIIAKEKLKKYLDLL